VDWSYLKSCKRITMMSNVRSNREQPLDSLIEQKQYENDLTVARWKEYQETGKTISNDAMTNWLVSWGTNQDKSCPTK